MFRPLEPRTVRWRSLPGFGQGEGYCHVDLALRAGCIVADGMSIGAIDGKPFAARFHIDCDEGWCVRRLTIETTDKRCVVLEADGKGTWRSGNGDELPALRGCIDIDLQASPFTNTLPIRRLGLQPTQGAVDLDMVYLPFDTFEPYRFAQRYTCLEADRRYFYENADNSFSAELAVDADGLVLDYPGLFQRLHDGTT